MDASSPKRYIGQTDLQLVKTGIRQARKLAAYFSKAPLDAIACSDLKRSLQTARIIAGNRPVKLEPVCALREVDLGEWDGLSIAAVKTCAPEEWQRRGESPAEHRPPGGESFYDLQSRVVPAFQTLIANLQSNLMIVGHAGVNRVILCHLLGIPLARLFCLGQDYAAVNLILSGHEGIQVQLINFTLS